MAARNFDPSDSVGRTSRRTLLRTLSAAPVAALAVPVASPWGGVLASLHEGYGDDPAILVRTKEGRSLSRFHYHRAESFFPGREPRSASEWRSFLYFAGISAQLALSAHLLDVGFEDQWCVRHIGLRVAKSLAYANATGLGHDCPDMTRLAVVLSPYNKWNEVRLFGEPPPEDGGLAVTQVRTLLRALLKRVHDVTGHPRPHGWRRDHRDTRS
jgi:hypothetical protein